MSRLRANQIAAIYAAASEADALDRITAVIREALDVDSVGIWMIENGRIAELTLTEDIVASAADYLAYYQTLDPWGGAQPRLSNRALLGSDFVSEESLLRSEFYNDFARHYGMLRPLGIVLDVAPGLRASLSLNRVAGSRLLATEDKPVVEEIGLHVRGALRLYTALQEERRHRGWDSRTLDLLGFGVVICAGDGVILYANPVAHALSRAGAGIVLGDARAGLGTRDPADGPALRALVRAAAVEGRPGAMRVAGADGGALSVVATPVPEPGGERLRGGQAFLGVSRTATAPDLQHATLRRLFGLSPAQAELCLQLADGKTFEEAATGRGIAVTTARTHFKAILGRTRTRNLRDLLRLLSSLPPVRLPP
ncbi:hypothetical protein OPKNFCMD_1950 [Methylobacterium crusticola]|uniref:HTH luxR-type domain-containing protein n=1 Tax=Methylobacterium crusticola TaxID=1697972 RepID=A0ABQ4QWF9_9HYPH|nr:helix-turn-helix transcriptional regulator [Methylobacterium crusticola]GJD49220.1 hypothetical protein OPKNFCMD_1950 [Methylobacterium crusticola]